MENSTIIKIGVFSGRFDPPNLGHFMTISKLIQSTNFMLIPILDYKERIACTAIEAKKIFEYCFNLFLPSFSCNKIKFIICNKHFGEIKRIEFINLMETCGIGYKDIIYYSGNTDVLSHMKSLFVKTEFVPRVDIPDIDQFIFESTKIREKMINENKKLEELYNLKL